MRTTYEQSGSGRANGAFEAELDRLVSEEVTALAPPVEMAVDALLDQVAERLRAHPDRAALLDRLRELVLGESAPPPVPPDPVPPSGDT
jgi:hypothetical protein